MHISGVGNFIDWKIHKFRAKSEVRGHVVTFIWISCSYFQCMRLRGYGGGGGKCISCLMFNVTESWVLE